MYIALCIFCRVFTCLIYFILFWPLCLCVTVQFKRKQLPLGAIRFSDSDSDYRSITIIRKTIYGRVATLSL